MTLNFAIPDEMLEGIDTEGNEMLEVYVAESGLHTNRKVIDINGMPVPVEQAAELAISILRGLESA